MLIKTIVAHGRSVTGIWGRDETKNMDLEGGGETKNVELLGDENPKMPWPCTRVYTKISNDSHTMVKKLKNRMFFANVLD